jgi:predicted Zn-dependent protease
MHKFIDSQVKQMILCWVILFSILPCAFAIPIGMGSQLDEFDDLLNSKELSVYSRDFFGSVVTAVHAGDREKAKLLVKRILSAYPEHPIAWDFDGTLKLMDGDLKGAERSLIKSLAYMPERAITRAKMGVVRLAQKHTDEARQLFQETLVQDPDNWIANRYLAQLADVDGNTQQAIEYYSRIVKPGAGEFSSIHAAYARDLARLKHYDEMAKLLEPLTTSKTDPELAMLLAEAYMNQGNVKAARQQLAMAKKMSPDEPRIELLSAIDQRISGQAHQSAQKLEQLIAKDNNNSLLYYHYGLALQQQDQSDQAISAFDNAVYNSPASSSLRVLLAREFEALKQPEKVIKTLEPLVKTQAKKDVTYVLVQAYADSGKWRKALMHAESMVERFPEFVPARLLKIEILRGLNRLEDAENYALNTVSQFPDSTEALKGYARILFKTSKQKKAFSKLNQMVEKQPDNRAISFMLANQYQFANYPKRAEKIYRQLLQTTPENAGLLNNLAVVLSQQTDKLNEALQLSQQAHQHAPDNALITDSFGWILYLAKQHVQAQEKLKLALEQSPDLLEAQCHLGLVLHEQGNRDVSLLEKCLQPTMNKSLQELAKQALDAELTVLR